MGIRTSTPSCSIRVLCFSIPDIKFLARAYHPATIKRMKVRPLQKKDISRAVAVILENHEREYAAQARQELEETFKMSAAIRPHYVVAEDRGCVAGIAGYMQSWMDYDIWLIFWVNVEPARQRQGIGKRLVRRAIADIKKQKGAKLILLSAASPRYYAAHFGFKAVKVFGKNRQRLMALAL